MAAAAGASRDDDDDGGAQVFTMTEEQRRWALPPTAPVNVALVNGDMLSSAEDVIAHQCNCVSKRGRGLAAVLFQRFAYADSYADRRSGKVKTHTPGETLVYEAPTPADKTIANMFCQYFGGAPKTSKRMDDTPEKRLRWFRTCIEQIMKKRPQTKSIALPFLIGCGLAKGSWDAYSDEIFKFAAKHPQVRVAIYRLL